MSASSQIQKEKIFFYSLLFADDLVFLNFFKEFGNAQAQWRIEKIFRGGQKFKKGIFKNMTVKSFF